MVSRPDPDHLGHGLHRSGFDFIIDDRSTSLAQAAENSFYDHVVAFPHIRFSEGRPLFTVPAVSCSKKPNAGCPSRLVAS